MLYDPTGAVTLEYFLTDELQKLPQLIEDRQARFDREDQAYRDLLAVNSLSAINALLFDGKDGSKRAASNDTERKLAIDFVIAQNPIKDVAEERDMALRELQYTKNRFEAAKLLVQLLTRTQK